MTERYSLAGRKVIITGADSGIGRQGLEDALASGAECAVLVRDAGTAAALNGVLREKCRETGLPLLIINYDLSDPRIVSREGILEQVNHFMENIMKARRLDI